MVNAWAAPREFERLIRGTKRSVPSCSRLQTPPRLFERLDFGSLEPSQEVLVDDSDLTRAAEIPEEKVILVCTEEAHKLTLEADAIGSGECVWSDPATWNRISKKTPEVTEDRATVGPLPRKDDALFVCQR